MARGSPEVVGQIFTEQVLPYDNALQAKNMSNVGRQAFWPINKITGLLDLSTMRLLLTCIDWLENGNLDTKFTRLYSMIRNKVK